MSFSLSERQVSVIRVALEPVYNVLNSFSLLNTGEEALPGYSLWVEQTASALGPERLHANRLLFEGLRDAVAPEQDFPDFPAYLRQLEAEDPYEIRDRALERLRARFSRRVSVGDSSEAPDKERLLSDVQAYLTCVSYVQVDTPFDAALHREAHALLNDPPVLHPLLRSHLEMLWETTIATEWRRVSRTLGWQVEMFARGLDEEMSIEETFHMFTGRQLPPGIAARLNESAAIIFVPSWHLGRHLTLWESETGGSRLFFSEPPNYDVVLYRDLAMGRGELRARLSALGDETRLKILELLAQKSEMSAQDIIAALDLSQSSVSRHLKQLVSLHYLYERRGEGANKTYRLSSFHFARTARALEQLAAGEEPRSQTPEEKDAAPQELRRFLDKSGKVTLWPPARQRDKLLILAYLASFFEKRRMYNEKEVNEQLLLHSTIKDYAALRRALYEYHFMGRERDGSRYWLNGAKNSEKDLRE